MSIRTLGFFALLAALHCNCAPALAQFETRGSVFISTEPFAIATGDFNRDGSLDLAVSSYYSVFNGVTILLGNGDGTFRLGGTYAAGVQLLYIAAASFRRNGILDLVVGDSLSNDVYVLLGNGDGTFQPAVPYPTSGNPFAVSTGDFNGDGKPDIIALARPASECACIEVLPGNGDGTFGTAIITPVPYNIDGYAFAAGRFNDDSKLDVAVSGAFGSGAQVDILLGHGDGLFRADGYYEVLGSPESVVVADFNGDGRADLAVGNLAGESVSVLLGNGDGTFQQAANYATQYPSWLIAADLDGDGKIDLAASNGGELGIPAGVSVLKGNGDGTFQPGVFYQAGREQVSYVAAGDFNGDGRPDLVVADFIDESVITLLNTGVVSFSPTTPVNYPFQVLGTTSPAQTVTLTNTGTSALTISAMKTTGPFATSSTCGSSVAPGAQCALSVRFSPTVLGAASGLISIRDSASSKPQVIEITGAGTVVGISPLSLNFGTQAVGSKSAPQKVQLTNTGTTTLSITQLIDSGNNPDDFPQTTNCPKSLATKASCTVTITFEPKKTGACTGTLSITDNGGGSPQTVPLTGTGD